MNLVNINPKTFWSQPLQILRLFLALVFLSAGVYRIFNPDAAISEFSALHLPLFLTPLMIVFEIGAGLLLLFNRFTKPVYASLLVFMIVVLAWSFIISGQALIKTARELFIFNLNSTDVFLHFVFLVIVLVLLIKTKKLEQ